MKPIKTYSKAELKSFGETDKTIHLCDCGCGEYRNEVPTVSINDKYYITGHEPS